mgnify:CR=1 FL=1
MFSYNVINTKGDIIASDGSNNIAYNYNAYGTELYNCSSANPIGYRNYYYDSETGLYYLKARYYDPTTGQFTQEDTVQDDNLQYNLYGYCSANPVLYTDPSGHWYYNINDYRKAIANNKRGTSLSFALNVSKEYNKNVNYIKKTKSRVNSGYIYSQDNDSVRGLTYGSRNFWYNGCEIAATYNLMRYINKNKKIQDVIQQFSLNGLRWLNGEWGTEPRDIRKYFNANNIKYTFTNGSSVSTMAKFVKNIKDKKMCIASCWNPFNTWKIHTFAFYKQGKKFYSYNGYNSKNLTNKKTYNSFYEMIGQHVFFCGYYSW